MDYNEMMATRHRLEWDLNACVSAECQNFPRYPRIDIELDIIGQRAEYLGVWG
jgi:hypothetical protein